VYSVYSVVKRNFYHRVHGMHRVGAHAFRMVFACSMKFHYEYISKYQFFIPCIPCIRWSKEIFTTECTECTEWVLTRLSRAFRAL